MLQQCQAWQSEPSWDFQALARAESRPSSALSLPGRASWELGSARSARSAREDVALKSAIPCELNAFRALQNSTFNKLPNWAIYRDFFLILIFLLQAYHVRPWWPWTLARWQCITSSFIFYQPLVSFSSFRQPTLCSPWHQSNRSVQGCWKYSTLLDQIGTSLR